MKAYGKSIGRRYEEKEDITIDDDFLNDYSKILQSKAYRRLAYKTQVICLPDNPHVRTRLSHTNEVVVFSIDIAKQLGLNENLCMAIAAGHDIGHTPYGHVGERILSKLSGKPFKHNINSVVVAQHVERKGEGMNLTYETHDGILNHSRGDGKLSKTVDKPEEYDVVMNGDKIAYIFSDLNDALRYGHLDESKIPECALKLGKNQRERVRNCLKSLVSESKEKGVVEFSEGPEFKNFSELKDFMYNEVYYKINTSLQEKTLENLYDYFSTSEDFSGIDPVISVSLLTDAEANFFGQLLLKSRKPSAEQIKHFGIFEIQYAIGSGLVGKHVEVNTDATQVAVKIIREHGRLEYPKVSILPNPDYVKYVITMYETAKKAIKNYRKLKNLESDRKLLVPY
ncbi:MAG: HD domain-containing protein [Candidatus Aenigmarchaeota archaeon]|nr:HD domain-containing protein [Candidatus Aenigmarchaeota archaeon]